MSITARAINKLPAYAQWKVDYLKREYKKTQSKSTKDKAYGYLDCLVDSGAISQTDFRLLYCYITL